MGEPQRPWRVRMLDYVAYMRSRGHRYTWLIFGQVVRPIGVYALKFHANDNQHQRPLHSPPQKDEQPSPAALLKP